jgi:hypothetical protein
MRDKYDIKKILRGNYFESFKKKDLKKNVLVGENYDKYQLTKAEVERLKSECKLTKSRIFRCFLLMKFALLDDTDRRGVELFKRDLQKYGKILSKDFDEERKMKNRSITKFVEPPYIAVTPKVTQPIDVRQRRV